MLLLVLVAACAPSPDEGTKTARPGSSVRLLFGGDVMLGRGVAPALALDPARVFEGMRTVVAAPDLAVANLESPLTARPHVAAAGPNALEAAPWSAEALADAGFDAVSIANNHAGDAGPRTVLDTAAALHAAGIVGLGEGRDEREAFAPRVIERDGIRVAFLAVDATGVGPRAGARGPGVAWWDVDRLRTSVERAHEVADVVTVSVHGGREYVPVADPYLASLGRTLAGWDVDVVWCHGPHVRQPTRVIDPDGDGRPTVVALSLGNLLFDQRVARTTRGGLLEVIAGTGGVMAYRLGTVRIEDASVGFGGWRAPTGTAVALAGGWWNPARDVVAVAHRSPSTEGFRGDIVDASLGDVDGDDSTELVVAFRRPYRRTEVNALRPRWRWVDERGRTAHLGVYEPGGLRPRWVAGTLLRPVARVAACDGGVAVAYDRLDDPAVVAAGAWVWRGFGFLPMPDLERPGVPACADVDRDGHPEPVVLGPTEGSSA